MVNKRRFISVKPNTLQKNIYLSPLAFFIKLLLFSFKPDTLSWISNLSPWTPVASLNVSSEEMDFFLFFPFFSPLHLVMQHINSPGFSILLFREPWGKFKLVWHTACRPSFPSKLRGNRQKLLVHSSACWILLLKKDELFLWVSCFMGRSPVWTPDFSRLHTLHMEIEHERMLIGADRLHLCLLPERNEHSARETDPGTPWSLLALSLRLPLSLELSLLFMNPIKM